MHFATLAIAGLATSGYIAFKQNERKEPQRDVFYIGGEYKNLTIGDATTPYKVGQIYVEKLTPSKVKQKYPIVFIHGSSQTGTNFLETSDGRPGWASVFLDKGYIVYLSDQASRGRSPWHPSIGSVALPSTELVEKIFTAISEYHLWPQAELHNQWPGTGKIGDPIFDAFYATQVPPLTDVFVAEDQNSKAYTALLDKIGPAHIVTHSQAGPFGWRVGDLRPSLAKSIVALEPAGPPFEPYHLFRNPRWQWGLAYHEITYEPSAGPNATSLRTVTIKSKNDSQTDCILQSSPAKKLKNLAEIPVLVVTGEASFHATHDFCTVKYLRQAGVHVDHVQLGEAGIHGNGHMFFMEKNNLQTAERVSDWLKGR